MARTNRDRQVRRSAEALAGRVAQLEAEVRRVRAALLADQQRIDFVEATGTGAVSTWNPGTATFRQHIDSQR